MPSDLAFAFSLSVLSFAYHSVFTGVLDVHGSYIVGGHLGNSQVKPAAGTIIHYRHKKKKAFKDTIAINEPTQEVLRVVVSVKLFTVSHEISF